MSEALYQVEGRPVFPGDLLHCPPHLFQRAGATVYAYRPADAGGEATMRSLNGAVPTVRVADLSWQPHPETVARAELEAAGFSRPGDRDVAVWLAAQRAAAQKGGA